jgi:hypothetical protein
MTEMSCISPRNQDESVNMFDLSLKITETNDHSEAIFNSQ